MAFHFGNFTKSAANFGRHFIKEYSNLNVQCLNPSTDYIATNQIKSNVSSIVFNAHHVSRNKNRYVIKDKSITGQFYKALKDIKKGMRDDAYFLKNPNQEENILCSEDIYRDQIRWYQLKRTNYNMLPQTTYNPDHPTVWMRVKDMYSNSKYSTQSGAIIGDL